MLSATKSTIARPQAASRQRTVSVRAQAPQKINFAQAAVAVLATCMIAMPVYADILSEKVKPIICASNPTAKICLKNSFVSKK
ncbi:MAG: hypothetical protein WDW38_000367 [Sanguina aurantia]